MIVSMFAGLQISSSALEPSGRCGENATYTFDSSTGLLTVSGTGEIFDYAFMEKNDIKSIVIEEGITSIGYLSICSCKNLTSVKLPDSLTIIDDALFENCSSLTSITVPNSVTSIGSEAFYGCSALTSITIPDSVISIGERILNNTAYYANWDNWDNDVLYVGNHLITAYYLSGDCTVKSGTKTIADSAFSNCSGLTSITIPDSVTGIGVYAFDNTAFYKDKNNWVNDVLYINNHLIRADKGISGECKIKEGTKSIAARAFYECEDLTSVIIPNTITYLPEYAFAYCNGLTNLDIPNSVTSIGYRTFDDCTSLTSVVIPNSVSIIGKEAFDYCTSLTSITIGNSVTSIGKSAFSWCSNLTKVNITDLAAWCKISFANYAANPVSYSEHLYLNDALLTDLVIPDSITSIGKLAFYCCTDITNLTIPNSVTSIGYRAFYYCKKMSTINFPASLRSIDEYAFSSCSSIEDIYYDGMPINWKAIDIKDDNDSLYYGVTMHYVIPEHEHTFDSGVVTKEATCSEKGIKTFTCSYCGTEKTEDIPKNQNGHDFHNGFCSSCALKDPNFDFPILTETCTKTVSTDENGAYCALFTPTQKGKITFYSTGNDDTRGSLCLYNSELDYKLDYLTSDYSSGEGRNFKITYNVEAGKEYVLNCASNYYSESLTFTFEYEVELHVHSYNAVVTPPTCTEQGYTTHICECGDVEKIDTYVPALGHTVVNDKAVAATCTKTGKTAGTHCSVCGEVLTAQTVTKALGHKWDAGKVTKKATPTATGIKTYTCKVCKAKKTATIAKCAKYANTITVKGKKVNVSFAKLKKANQTIARNSVLSITKAQGKLSYAKVSGNKNIGISKSTGIIIVKKGLKKGTYKIGVKVTAAGNASYKAGAKTATVTIVVK